MSTNVPTISVTADPQQRCNYEHHSSATSSDSDDSSSNDMDYNQNMGGLTDVEDFDSSADVNGPRSRRSSKNSLVIPKNLPNAQGEVTDVEDYNDSEADEGDAKNSVCPDFKFSLQEFLRHDFQEQLSSCDGVKEMVEHKPGNFLLAQNLNTLNDYLTDCEDFSTDSDIENNFEKSACVDLGNIVDLGNVNIADSAAARTNEYEGCDCDFEDNSVASNLSSVAFTLSDAMGKEMQGMSENEILELSSNEEICQISCSDSDSISNAGNISDEDLLSSASMPPIDVTFIHATTNIPTLENNKYLQGAVSKSSFRKNMFLEVAGKRKEEVLTDTERFDDSVAASSDDDSFDGDDDNEQPIPQAVILAVGDDGGCTTDCEDLFCDDVSEAAVSRKMSVASVDLNAIPITQREIIMLQEDKFGDTIASVMPMDKEYQFGMYASQNDECLTDIEEYSCADDMDMQLVELPSRSPSPSAHNVLVESDITISNELLKTQQSKRLEIISNTESVTDVEEIFMAGTNSRKKKHKSRPVTKNKSKFLETPKPSTREESGGGTDIEDMDFSDGGLLVPSRAVKQAVETSRQSNHSHSEKVTDIEDITADDFSSVSEAELPLIDTNTSNLKDYVASSKNIVITLETCGSVTCGKNNKPKNPKKTSEYMQENRLITNKSCQQQQTDVEDVQLPTDTEEEGMNMNMNVPTVDSVCQELNEMLSESCTTVHEKCCNSFNIDAEKLHIKGMLHESHTDIEYVESDESAARGSK